MSEQDIADAVKNAADSSAAANEREGEAAKAETTEHIAKASEAATTAATAAVALAEAKAAETINDNKDNLEWLHQHATRTDTSLNELAQGQKQLMETIPSLLEAQRTRIMESLSPLLTPPKSLETGEEIPEVIPEVIPEEESEKQAGRKAKSAAPEKKEKPRRTWL